MDVVQQVKKSKKGDKEALLRLIMTEKDAYYRLAYAYMRNESDALDALEDMIVKLYEGIHQLKKPEAFYSWSKTILVNQCKQSLRRRQKLFPAENLQNERGGENTYRDSHPSQVEERMVLQELLQQLNDEQREAIQLKYYRDLDYGAIAAITKVPTGTVKSRVFHGLKKLRALLGKEERE
ncbi:RNA polymerase subunit sigma-24 [Bacillus sp. FJAT-27264]|uniref:RNA polymerase sigma factor n=1 Tax=Paenibacillus sp. (strain DSM 101736 / FJAT-27264) TaxID=1850362 RepID=UPI000807F09D|nr:RNA polymerase sigma factor [Bacillus sp. FJAT-27264]OBZ18127.1 RNA polymerase subunit sigma-24 [Bacillus sp. FJAT-27264]